MPLEFVTPSAAEPTLNALLYGPPGTGKTVGAASAPGPILYLNAEGENALRKARQIHSGTEFHEVAVTGKAVLDEAYLHLRSGAGKEKTVVVDTIGEVYRILLEELASTREDGRPTLQTWGDVNTIIERFIRALRDLPVNMIVVCHEEVVRDEVTGETLRQPITGGRKLPALLMAMVDVVAYTGVVPGADGEPPKYVAQLVAANGRHGKDRTGVLGKTREVNVTEWVNAALNPTTGRN